MYGAPMHGSPPGGQRPDLRVREYLVTPLPGPSGPTRAFTKLQAAKTERGILDDQAGSKTRLTLGHIVDVAATTTVR